jgi:hypothetical protein
MVWSVAGARIRTILFIAFTVFATAGFRCGEYPDDEDGGQDAGRTDDDPGAAPTGPAVDARRL